jgi:hypothetical protein
MVVYVLKDMSLDATPIPGLVHDLHMFFPGSFAYVPIVFDLSEDSETLTLGVSALARSLTHGELKW